jgi:hypothetical protein
MRTSSLGLVAILGVLGCGPGGTIIDITDPAAVVDKLVFVSGSSSALSPGTTRILVGDTINLSVLPQTTNDVAISNVRLKWVLMPSQSFSGIRRQLWYIDTSFVAASPGIATIRVETAEGVRTTTGAPVSWQATFDVRPR